MMRTEDLLADCLEAQAHGRSPQEILGQNGTADQCRELEPLLDLAGRLRRLPPVRLRPTVRTAIAARLHARMARDAAAALAEPEPPRRVRSRATDLSRAPEVHCLAAWFGLIREDLFESWGFPL